MCLCVSQWGCFCVLRLDLAKPLCRCVQYAISSDGIITLTLKYSKERPLTVVQSLGSDDQLILNSLQDMCSRAECTRLSFKQYSS